jgi:phosphate starvation-inducible protein PhoH
MMMMSHSDETPWYAPYPTLSRGVKLIATLPEELQELIGNRMMGYAKELVFNFPLAKSEEIDASTQGLEKLKSLMFNKSNHHPLIGRGLNETMSLDDSGRTMVGTRLMLALQAIDTVRQIYGDSALQNRESRVQIYNLIQSIFTEDLQTFENQGRDQKLNKQEKEALEEAEKIALEEAEQQAVLDAIERHRLKTGEGWASAVQTKVVCVQADVRISLVCFKQPEPIKTTEETVEASA